jgi:glyoxylase-like metal-dependent hydrolase (beta-lactamase superfamily II)
MIRALHPRVVKASNAGPFTLDGTRSYLVGRELVAVIDPGPDAEEHVRALSRALEGAKEVRILLTHRHPDHSGGADRLARVLSARVPASTASPTSLADGDELTTDEGTLVVVETPGHTRDHLAFHWLEARALFVGDLLLGKGNTTWVGEYPGCVAEYLASLRKIGSLVPEILYPSHGAPLTSPAKTLSTFESHRLRRIDQVRRAMARHPQVGLDQLVELVYGDSVPPRMAKAAMASVEMILHHLRDER